MGRRYAIALSFANLVYLSAWDSLVVGQFAPQWPN
jgi:hypothetical protein